MNDDFYVGYHKQAAPRVASFLRKAVPVVVVTALVVGVVALTAHRRVEVSVYEAREIRELEGVIQEAPYPMLLVERPGQAASAAPYSRYLIVRSGRYGAAEDVRGLNGRRARVPARLIYRGNHTVLQLAGPIEPLDGPVVVPPDPVRVHDVAVVGEVVDGKCYLGRMSPGGTKVHRGCAAQCIRGGIPPILASIDPSGVPMYFLLTSPDGAPVKDAVIPFVAERVRVRGSWYRHGDLYELRADPSTYERVP